MSEVKMERRPPKHVEDLKAKKMILWPLKVVTIVFFILSVVLWLAFCFQDSPEEVKEYNQRAEKFNVLATDERELVKELASDLKWRDDAKLKLKAEPDTWLDMMEIEADFVRILIVVLLIVFFIQYWAILDEKFYLADFPRKTVYGWFVLLLCLPFGWPFMIVSWVRMRCYFRKYQPTETMVETEDPVAEVEEEAQESAETEAENQDVDAENTRADDLEDVEEANGETKVEVEAMTEEERDLVREDYVKLRMEDLKKRRRKEIDDLNNSIESALAQIQSYGAAIQRQQKELGEFRAKYAQLTQGETSLEDTLKLEEIDRRTALSELKKIWKMRGVTRVEPSPGSGNLEIFVQVRVPYQNMLYDFGDYTITFRHYDSFDTYLERSGVKENAETYTPFYQDGPGFCFGDRSYEIETYVEQGRVIEALTLMIDCMHSVNRGDEKYIPGCFKCVSEAKKPKKRRKGGKRR